MDEIFIDRREFRELATLLTEKLDELTNKIDRMSKQQSCLDGDTLLDNQDLCLMLKVCKRTLQRYRAKGLLPYYMIDGKVYYKSSDLHEFIRKYFNG